MLFKIKPLPNKLYPFGARAIVHVHKELQDKLDWGATEFIVLGYPTAGSGWLFYSPKLRHIVHSTSAVFPEYQELKVVEAREDRSPLVAEGEAPLDQTPEDLAEILELDKIVRQIRLVLGGEPTSKIAEAELKAIANLPKDPEHKLPKTIKSALTGADLPHWRSAAEYKIDKFKSLGVWETVNPHKDVKALGSR
jgi:hypothetical protein